MKTGKLGPSTNVTGSGRVCREAARNKSVPRDRNGAEYYTVKRYAGSVPGRYNPETQERGTVAVYSYTRATEPEPWPSDEIPESKFRAKTLAKLEREIASVQRWIARHYGEQTVRQLESEAPPLSPVMEQRQYLSELVHWWKRARARVHVQAKNGYRPQ